MRNYFLYFFSFFFSQIFLFSSVKSQSPGTPSSSYDFDYYSKEKKNNEIDPNILLENTNVITNIIVQGNKRLESNLIINESQIQTVNFVKQTLPETIDIIIGISKGKFDLREQLTRILLCCSKNL